MSNKILFFVVLAVLIGFNPAPAANPTVNPPGSTYVTADEFNQKIGLLQNQIAELTQLVKANSQPSIPAPEPAGKLVKLPTLEERVINLEKELNSLKNRVSEQDYVVKDLTKVGADGLVSLNPDNRVLWQGVNEQLRRTAPQTGTVLVQNNMLTPQYMRINGQLHVIPALDSREFSVPVGTVSTELPGYEAPKNWMIGAPEYRQTIVINPRSEPGVSYPIYEPEPWWTVYP